MVHRRVQAVTAARSKGNDFFKAGRFQEASAAYGEGLDHDSRNSVLLCNRAACLFKMGQFDRAIEDSTSALTVRPAYAKARLRRADCNAKVVLVCVNVLKIKCVEFVTLMVTFFFFFVVAAWELGVSDWRLRDIEKRDTGRRPSDQRINGGSESHRETPWT